MPLAALIKGTELEDLPGMIAWYERQLKQLGVRVRTGTEVDAAAVAAAKPDAVVVAVGDRLTIPPVTGVGGPNVLTTPELHKRVKPFLGRLGSKKLGRLTHYFLGAGGHHRGGVGLHRRGRARFPARLAGGLVRAEARPPGNECPPPGPSLLRA